MKKIKNSETKICILGLGYVGLPLAIEFGKYYDTIGFDISETRIKELRNFRDRTKEVKKNQFRAAKKLIFSQDEECIKKSNLIIVTVPTPIKKNKKPDLGPIKSASKAIGKNIKKGSIVVYESTVYPGLTEEICIPIIEKISGLIWKKDFFVGYSPERINPGDTKKSLTNITKVVSGDTKKTLKFLDEIYSSIIKAGTFKADSIKIAEAAKVIENTQRDLNIAFMNELSIIFNKMDIDTKKVIAAAGSKWNFHTYSPGLVGGHCIGVDPYYLTHKANELGIDPKIILGGRDINDKMHKYVISNLNRLSKELNINFKKSKILVLGATFKENCPDLRNSRVWDLFMELKKFSDEIKIHDYEANIDELRHKYGEAVYGNIRSIKDAEILIIATPHKKYITDDFIRKINKSNIKLIIDIKSALKPIKIDASKIIWSL